MKKAFNVYLYMFSLAIGSALFYKYIDVGRLEMPLRIMIAIGGFMLLGLAIYMICRLPKQTELNHSLSEDTIMVP